MEYRHGFGRGLLAAYFGLKAFDKVHCEPLWEILMLNGIPTSITELIASTYTWNESTVKCFSLLIQK